MTHPALARRQDPGQAVLMSWWHVAWPYGLALVSLACTLTGTLVAVRVILHGEQE
jgi:hypothetical protein